MELKFNSIEEVMEFAARVQPAPAPGDLRFGSVDPAAFVDALARVARSRSKIAAIKLYRAVFGTGLRDSKIAVECAPEFRVRPEPAHLACGDPDCGCGPSL